MGTSEFDAGGKGRMARCPDMNEKTTHLLMGMSELDGDGKREKY